MVFNILNQLIFLEVTKILINYKKNDIIKTRYCYNNAIFLLRIDYTEIENIDYWLDIFLDKNFGINGENLILTTDDEKYNYLNLYSM